MDPWVVAWPGYGSPRRQLPFPGQLPGPIGDLIRIVVLHIFSFPLTPSIFHEHPGSFGMFVTIKVGNNLDVLKNPANFSGRPPACFPSQTRQRMRGLPCFGMQCTLSDQPQGDQKGFNADKSEKYIKDLQPGPLNICIHASTL